MAIALHHMNHGGADPQVGLVPDRLEYFAGHGRDLLPRLFTHLLCLCLEDREEEEGEDQEKRAFVRQFWIPESLGWMREQVRKHLGTCLPPDGSAAWVFEELRIGAPPA